MDELIGPPRSVTGTGAKERKRIREGGTSVGTQDEKTTHIISHARLLASRGRVSHSLSLSPAVCLFRSLSHSVLPIHVCTLEFTHPPACSRASLEGARYRDKGRRRICRSTPETSRSPRNLGHSRKRLRYRTPFFRRFSLGPWPLGDILR